MKKVEVEILDYTTHCCDFSVIGVLDITDSKNFPLSISYLISDGKDLETRFGDFSKTFEVPATKHNNKLLQHISNPLIIDNKHTSDLKDCRILVDGLEFFKGKIQVKGSKQSSKPLSYSCTIFGGNYGWLSQLKTKTLCDLYDDTFTFDYKYDVITDTWDYDNTQTDVIYPLVSYGDFYPEGNVLGNSIPSTNTKNFTKSPDWRPWWFIYNLLKKIFDNIGYSLDSSFINDVDFKKLITHFNIPKQSLEGKGGCFVTRKYWDTTDSNDGFWDVTDASRDYQEITASNSTTFIQAGNDTGWFDIKHDIEIDDVDNAYEPSTGVWTCPQNGYYKFGGTVQLLIGNWDNDQAVEDKGPTENNYPLVSVRLLKNGVTSLAETSAVEARLETTSQMGKITTLSTSPAYPSTLVPLLVSIKRGIETPNSFHMQTGDTVVLQSKVVMKSRVSEPDIRWGVVSISDEKRHSYSGGGIIDIQGFTSPFYKTTYAGQANIREIWEDGEKPFFKVESISNDLSVGNTYKYNEILPCDTSQIDFIKGISHMFNLQFRTDISARTIYIEPFDDFYKDKSLAVDWSEKVDYSKPAIDKYGVLLNEELSFEYKNDGSDGLMKYINEQFKEPDKQYHFFNHLEVLGENYNKGIKRYTNPLFSSTWCDWDADVSGYDYSFPPLLPIINKSESVFGYTVEPAPVRPEKIHKYNPRILYYKGHVRTPNYLNMTTYWCNLTTSGSIICGGVSPRATFVDWGGSEAISGTKFTNLSYSDELIKAPFSSVETTEKGLYSLYWKNMIDELKENPRIRTMELKLTTQDIVNLDLSKLVYINGTYWRVNKIIDFSPIKEITTKVEFIQVI